MFHLGVGGKWPFHFQHGSKNGIMDNLTGALQVHWKVSRLRLLTYDMHFQYCKRCVWADKLY